MDVKEVLAGQGLTARLEKHEAECALRYARIEERLEDQKDSLRRLDLKIWGIALLIITTPFVNKLVG
tara:strand:- start:283 stop:483 length:201 start_codon:yes stop_codon:yes gene_type:complete